MDAAFIAEHLKLPPELVRLREMYPHLPDPIPLHDADALGPWCEEDGHAPELRGCYFIHFLCETRDQTYAVPEQHHRIVEEYWEAQERQAEAEEACAAARWENRSPGGAPPEPEPEAIPPRGELTPRQEEFCRHYATQPVATRAAVLAGYSEENAAPYGSRLLKNPLVLERIAALRAEKKIEYVVERDTMHDKLEAVFFEALGDRNPAAAVAALRLQAMLAGLTGRSAAPAASDTKAKESQVRRAEKPRKAKAVRRQTPRKAKVGRRKKPSEAKESQ